MYAAGPTILGHAHSKMCRGPGVTGKPPQRWDVGLLPK